jgi:pimeloyl-ACP methyl ester carboxylesterase
MRPPPQHRFGLAAGAAVGLVLAASPGSAERAWFDDGGAGIAYEVLGAEGPPLVLLPGLGDGVEAFRPLAGRLAGCARVLLYDRAGTGDSPGPPPPVVTAADVGAQLGHLLDGAGLTGAAVLVGHSMGGLYAQAFARDAPERTAAVVLIDAASPFEPPGVFVSTTPPEPGTASAAEDAGFEASVTAMRAGPPFPPVPLIVLAATEHGSPPDVEATWQEVQRTIAAQSPLGEVRRVEGGHFIHLEHPDVVLAAVLDTMDAAGLATDGCRRNGPGG